MSIENTSCRVSYSGNDVTTDFATTFAFLAAAHLVVKTSTDGGTTWTTLTLDADYSVSGAGDPEPGGTVTMGAAPASGTTLRIERHTPITQEAVLQTSGPLPSKTIIQAFDKLTMIAQEARRDIDDLTAGGALPVAMEGQLISKLFSTQERIEDSYPLDVACSGTPTGVQIFRIEDLTNPDGVEPDTVEGDEIQKDFGTPDWGAPTNGGFTIGFIPGLEPLHDYRVTFLVLTQAVS